MWILQQDEPDDYIVAKGGTHSMRELLEATFGHEDLHWRKYVEHTPRYLRPAEVALLAGDSSRAQTKLGSQPTTFADRVKLMARPDITPLKPHRERRIKVIW